MKKYSLIHEKLHLDIVEIILKNGRIIKNYPIRGNNLITKEQIINHLQEYGIYHITLGNNRRQIIKYDDVKEIR